MLKKIYISLMAFLTLSLLFIKVIRSLFFADVPNEGKLMDEQSILEETQEGESISQLMAVVYPSYKPNDELKNWIEDNNLSNFILFSTHNKLEDLDESKTLIDFIKASVRDNGHTPLLMIDQEGGRVNRLRNLYGDFPSARAATQLSSMERRQYAKEMAKKMTDLGVDLNLAPVVDSVDLNSYMTDRSFGNQAGTIVSCAKDFIEGCHEVSVGCVLKHFPGIGSMTNDPHTSQIKSHQSKEQYLAKDLKPFIELMPYTDAIMSTHLLVPAVDSKVVTVSKVWMEEILRQELGYEGVVLSDSLSMLSMLGDVSTEEDIINRTVEVMLEALDAGCDMLLICPWEFSGEHKLDQYPFMVKKIIDQANRKIAVSINLQNKLQTSIARIERLKSEKLNLKK